MKHVRSNFFIPLFAILLSNITLGAFSQGTIPGNLYGPLTVGAPDAPIVEMYGELAMQDGASLHMGDYTPGLQTNELRISGEYTADEGSSLFMSIIDNSNTTGTRAFIDINGTAMRNGGSTQIILDMFDADDVNGSWDGTIIDLVRADNDSDPATFDMTPVPLANGRIASLLHRMEGDDIIWYIGETEDPCLDVIQQRRNHTLVVNNNMSANGGYTFVQYTWYKDDVLIENVDDRLGYYYTQFDHSPNVPDLDFTAEYYAEVVDYTGGVYTTYKTCPYTPVELTSFKVDVYPNPVGSEQDISVEITDLNWETTTITVYDAAGRLMVEVPATGDITQVTMPQPPGTYIVKVKSGGVLKQTKVVVR